MTDKGWIKSITNIFGQKKPDLPYPNLPKNAPRKVNFTVNSEKQETKTVTFGNFSEEKTLNQQLALKKAKNNETEQFQQLPKQIQEQPEIDLDERYEKIDCKLTFKQLLFTKDDILPGQTIVFYQKKNIEYKLRKKTYISGEFILTNFKFVFRPSDKDIVYQRQDFLKVPLGLLDKIEKRNDNSKKKQQDLPKLMFTLKDTREFKFRLPTIDSLKKLSDEIIRFAFVTQKRHFFAFRYFQNNKQLQEKYEGWKIYNPFKEFERMKLIVMPHTEKIEAEFTSNYKYLDNKDGKICSTYPSILIVPSRMPYDYIIRCSKFRSRERLPVLTYAFEYSPGNLSSLFRCSQNKLGVSRNRCLEDEMMLRMIGDPKSQIRQQYKGPPNCKIYDARGYYAALGNVFGGKGYELPQFYKNCKIEWLDIPNIHTVRDSYIKLKKAALGDQSNFLNGLAESSWYDYVFLIISGAKQIAISLSKGVNCVVHCSDGWDRTAQLCALAQILLDPYYRTIQGFQVLIEKDWISFGHQFSERFGQGSNHPTNEQKSPIFIQFLDCISQLMYQFPLSFQFNYKYLNEIIKNALTHIFGNFLCDSQLQQLKTSVIKKTVSLWSHMKQYKQKFLNPYYQPNWLKYLDVSVAQKEMRFWKEHFMYYVNGSRDSYSIYSCEWTDENRWILHKQLKQQKELLKDKHKQNQDKIKALELAIQQAKARKSVSILSQSHEQPLDI